MHLSVFENALFKTPEGRGLEASLPCLLVLIIGIWRLAGTVNNPIVEI